MASTNPISENWHAAGPFLGERRDGSREVYAIAGIPQVLQNQINEIIKSPAWDPSKRDIRDAIARVNEITGELFPRRVKKESTNDWWFDALSRWRRILEARFLPGSNPFKFSGTAEQLSKREQVQYIVYTFCGGGKTPPGFGIKYGTNFVTRDCI